MRRCVAANPDGWGIMYLWEGKPKHRKGLDTKSFFEAYDELGDLEMYIHLRIKTHGNVTIKNAHPFVITGSGEEVFYLMHNGVFNIACDIDANRSDSWHFAKKVVKPLIDAAIKAGKDPHELIRSEPFRNLMSRTHDKIVIMDKLGGVRYGPWQTLDTGMHVSNTYTLGYSARAYNRHGSMTDEELEAFIARRNKLWKRDEETGAFTWVGRESGVLQTSREREFGVLQRTEYTDAFEEEADTFVSEEEREKSIDEEEYARQLSLYSGEAELVAEETDADLFLAANEEEEGLFVAEVNERFDIATMDRPELYDWIVAHPAEATAMMFYFAYQYIPLTQ